MPKDPRNKQVIVRMTDDDRERFKEFCKANDLEVSGFLCELVRRFNDGSLTLAHIQVATDSDIDSEVVADIKKSLAADLAGMVRAEVEKAIAAITPPPQTTVTGAENVSPGGQTQQTDQIKALPLSDGDTQGELMEVETAIEPSGVPNWLEVGKEYTQIELGRAMKISDSTFSKALKRAAIHPDITVENSDLQKLIELNKQELFIKQGTKWIYKPE